MNRCTGHCCKNFPLPASLEEIRRRRNKEVCPPGELWIEDGDKLASMLVPLHEGTYPDGSPAWFFTCKHHDPVSGDCMDYENRPRMCSDYPYGQPCKFYGCTMANRGVPYEKPEPGSVDWLIERLVEELTPTKERTP